MSGSDRLSPLQRKMERYIANGALLAWLIDPYHRRVYRYRPGAPVEILEDPGNHQQRPGFARLCVCGAAADFCPTGRIDLW